VPGSRVLEPPVEQHVVSHPLDVRPPEFEGLRDRSEHRRPVAGEHRRDEDQQPVDAPVGEERCADRRPSLEEERLDAFRGERDELVVDRAGSELELGSFRERPTAEREPTRRGRGAPTPRASRRGASARAVPIPTATASTSARSS